MLSPFPLQPAQYGSLVPAATGPCQPCRGPCGGGGPRGCGSSCTHASVAATPAPTGGSCGGGGAALVPPVRLVPPPHRVCDHHSTCVPTRRAPGSSFHRRVRVRANRHLNALNIAPFWSLLLFSFLWLMYYLFALAWFCLYMVKCRML